MKKLALILTLALTLVGALAAVALADPSHYASGNDSTVWLTTTAAVDWTANPPGGVSGTPWTPTGQKVHSSYAANTDACASCHSVHYAQDGVADASNPDLLQATDPSLLCISCHDGTIANTYNVMAGTFNATDDHNNYRNTAGLFAVTYDNGSDTSASQHDVFGGVNIVSAPGGKGTNTQVANDTGAWSGTLECTSCHDPHSAGGNPRLLQPNPNGIMAQVTGVQLSTNPAAYAAGTYTSATDNGVTKYWFKNSNANTVAKLTYKPSLAIPEITDISKPNTVDNRTKLNVYINGVKVSTSGKGPFTIGYDQTNGYYLTITDTVNSGAVTVDYEPVLIVKGTIQNELTSTEYESGFDKTMAGFCGSCHISFVGARSATNTGMYTGDTHHNGDIGNSGKAPQTYYGWNVESSCLTCHSAHGVDTKYWMDETRTALSNHNSTYKTDLGANFTPNPAFTTGTNSGVVAPQGSAAAYGVDATDNIFASGELKGKSDIKRLPNMGICESCHTKGFNQGSVADIY